jgi:flagellar assembly protein FliH
MTPRPFTFDTDFGGEGDLVIAAPRVKRSFTAEEVEAVRAEAFAAGEASALAAAEAAKAAAVARLAETARAGLTTLAAVAHGHRESCATLALACADKIAGHALALFPAAPIEAAMHALAAEIAVAPQLSVRLSAAEPAVVAAVEEAAAAAGFAGRLVVTEGASLDGAAFVFDWGEGRARFDPAAAAERVGEALRSALAAEGVHGEALPPTEPGKA